jgi:predicted alpha-1,6-mannanase (GH76 family)
MTTAVAINDLEQICQDLKELKHKNDKVELLLKYYPEARNNDNYLIYLYWKLADQCETLEDIIHATPPEVIRRTRQKIQNEYKKYVPTRENIRRRRRQ